MGPPMYMPKISPIEPWHLMHPDRCKKDPYYFPPFGRYTSMFCSLTFELEVHTSQFFLEMSNFMLITSPFSIFEKEKTSYFIAFFLFNCHNVIVKGFYYVRSAQNECFRVGIYMVYSHGRKTCVYQEESKNTLFYGLHIHAIRASLCAHF